MHVIRFPIGLRDDVGTGDAYPQEDVEHGSAETGGEPHDGGEDGDGHVGDKVGEGVAHREDGEADDGVGKAEDEAESLVRG